ncbi:unnamed protein product [Vitrella brassicaformis CCMP3155]|uniref:WD repeat-containing protein 75 second beta-propeller domain-containing protein n=3 Tax=Vitrella brassicaformis TaxID=1169539 RepID=A0A0G4EX35_VITBC|nr:unnamed protein product [Vitrella brassicaformis CCMP3155]|eukprot:CEM03557.1 unnamed protein product [Vitrella brassicaformis CCMP3155]
MATAEKTSMNESDEHRDEPPPDEQQDQPMVPAVVRPFTRTSGGCITAIRPAFSLDGSLLACACVTDAVIYSTKTGKRVAKLTDRHKMPITAVCPSADNGWITAELDGTLCLWSSDHALLTTHDLEAPILDLQFAAKERKYYALIVGKAAVESDDNHQHMSAADDRDGDVGDDGTPSSFVYQLTISHRSTSGHIVLSAPGSHGPLRRLAIRGDGSYVAAATRRRVLVLSADGHLTKHKSGQPIVSIMIRPDTDVVITGDRQGVMHMLTVDKKAGGSSVRMQHWHAHAVSSLAHVSGTESILSTGEEAVLCMWNLTTHERKSLPRMGAAILQMAVADDGSQVALCLANNCVRVVDIPQWKIAKSIYGVDLGVGGGGRTPDLVATRGTRRVCDALPRTQAADTETTVMLWADPSRVQFYSLTADEHRGHVEMARGRMYVSRVDEQEGIKWTVEQACLSPDRQHMLTVETRREERPHPRCVSVVKFWSQQSDYGYRLVNRVDLAHQEHITMALARPMSPDCFLTTSADGTFKVWHPFPSANSSTPFFAPSSVNTFRNIPITCAAFSSDGSLLALGHSRGCVSLWAAQTDGDQWDVSETMTCGASQEAIHSVAFVEGPSLLCLAVAYNHNRNRTAVGTVVLWDLLTMTVATTIQLPAAVTHLLPSPSSHSSLLLIGMAPSLFEAHTVCCKESQHTQQPHALLQALLRPQFSSACSMDTQVVWRGSLPGARACLDACVDGSVLHVLMDTYEWVSCDVLGGPAGVTAAIEAGEEPTDEGKGQLEGLSVFGRLFRRREKNKAEDSEAPVPSMSLVSSFHQQRLAARSQHLERGPPVWLCVGDTASHLLPPPSALLRDMQRRHHHTGHPRSSPQPPPLPAPSAAPSNMPAARAAAAATGARRPSSFAPRGCEGPQRDVLEAIVKAAKTDRRAAKRARQEEDAAVQENSEGEEAGEEEDDNDKDKDDGDEDGNGDEDGGGEGKGGDQVMVSAASA